MNVRPTVSTSSTGSATTTPRAPLGRARARHGAHGKPEEVRAPLLVQTVGAGQPAGQRPLRAAVPGRRGHPGGGGREEGQGGGQAGRHRGGGSRGHRRQGRCRGGGCRGSQAARSGGALQIAGECHRGGPGGGRWCDLQGVLQHEPGPVAHSARVQEADAPEGSTGQVYCPPEEGERTARSRVAGDAGDARRGGGCQTPDPAFDSWLAKRV